MDREEETIDAAAEAFDAVRGEIALLRRAIERLAVEKMDVPDYAVTLGAIGRDQRLAAERIDVLASSPVLSLTPAAVGAQVEKVAADVRRGEHQVLDGVRRELEAATKAITARIASARSRDRQFYWLAGASVAGFVAGILFLVLLIGPVARALPATWHMPEKIAAWTMGTSMWEAGSDMMEIESLEGWHNIVASDRLFADNKVAIQACRKAAAKAKRAVQCAIKVSS